MPFTDQRKDHVSPLILWGHWFTFANMILAMLIGLRFIAVQGWPDTLLGQFYTVINLIGHSAFMAFALYVFVLFPITLLLPFSHILRGVGAIVATIGLTLLAFDAEIFSHYRLHLNPFLFDIASSDLTALFDTPLLIALPLGILSLQLVLANGLWKRLDKIRRRRLGSKVVGVLIGCFVSAHLIHIWADATGYRPIIVQDDIYPLHYPATAKGFITRQGILEKSQLGQLDENINGKAQLRYPLAPLQCQAQSPKQNVLLITIDGWRKNMVNDETMPFISQFAQQSHWFTQHDAASNQASHGLFTLLYGMVPSYRQPLFWDRAEPLLLAQFQNQGYQIDAIGYPNFHQEADPQLWLQGTQRHSNTNEQLPAEQDIVSTDLALTLLAQPKPHFILLNYQATAHYSTPIGEVALPTVRAQAALNPAQQVLFNQYRQSLHFLDGQLQRLLSQVGDDTIVVITGLNGHLFTTDMNSNNYSNFSLETSQVPLLIHWPKQPAKQIDYPTSHYGIAPTLMTHVLQCSNPIQDYSLGEALYQPSALNYLILGNNRRFAVRTPKGTSVISDSGSYRVYNDAYQRDQNHKLDVQTFLKMMEEGRRFRTN